jgi:hypothetical protein
VTGSRERAGAARRLQRLHLHLSRRGLPSNRLHPTTPGPGATAKQDPWPLHHRCPRPHSRCTRLQRPFTRAANRPSHDGVSFLFTKVHRREASMESLLFWIHPGAFTGSFFDNDFFTFWQISQDAFSSATTFLLAVSDPASVLPRCDQGKQKHSTMRRAPTSKEPVSTPFRMQRQNRGSLELRTYGAHVSRNACPQIARPEEVVGHAWAGRSPGWATISARTQHHCIIQACAHLSSALGGCAVSEVFQVLRDAIKRDGRGHKTRIQLLPTGV